MIKQFDIGGLLYAAPPNITGFVTLIDYQGGTNATYIGYAPSGSSQSAFVWAIKMITYDGNNNPTEIAWGSTGASNLQWSQRATYTYS